jgi:signal transduction histidine kinase
MAEMKIFGLLNSFRARLLLLLAVMLGLTLGVQYYVNQRAIESNAQLIVEQEQAIMAGVALGVNSIFSTKYLDELRSSMRVPLLDEREGRVKNVMVVDSEGLVQDSLLVEYAPTENEDKTIRYVQIKDVPLPPLTSAVELPDERESLPPWLTISAPLKPGDPGAFYFPLETTKGRRYVIVVLGSANTLTNILQRQASRSALYTLLLLLATTLVTGLFVWRFTRPIKVLSAAARKVAGGDFGFRVPEERRDELGQFAVSFNEMTTQLARARELEAQLHEAEKGAVVGRLAAAIAHEIRNPLNYINLTLDHLRSSLAPEDEGKRETFLRLATQLKAEVVRINRHITDFLKYSRPSTLDFQPVDLRAEAEDALRLIEVQAAEHNVHTAVETTGSLPAIVADRETLRSAFTNLVINGLQAIDGDGGNITIKLSNENDERVRVEIIDTGKGIAPADISKVFEPYYSTKDTGTGLGLAIVRKAVEDHGGTVNVHSKQGSGTTFTIILPVKPEQA